MSGKVTAALGVVLVLIVILVLIDHWQHTRQMRALNETLLQLRQTLERGVVASAPGVPAVAPAPGEVGADAAEPFPPPDPDAYADPVRDGRVKLDQNFLLPLQDWFRPALLGGTITDYQSTPKGLNSIIEDAYTNSQIDKYTSDGLCMRDQVDLSRWRAALATSCVISDDYTVFTFTIRQGVYWHVPPIAVDKPFLAEPVELTAEDFVFYLRMIQDPNVACDNLRNYYEALDTAEALDRYTFRMTWKEKLYTNIDFSLGLEPLPRHVYGVDEEGRPIADEDVGVAFNKHWFDLARQHVGVGPYRLLEYVPDQRLVFERNERYYGSTYHFERVVWNLAVQEPQAMLTGFKNGDVQSRILSPQQYQSEILDGGEPRFAPFDGDDPHAGRTGELGWERVKRPAYRYIGWNMRRPLFADRRVRQAMSHAYPRARVIAEVFCGLGQPINSGVHPDTPYYHHDLSGYDHSPAQAARLLSEAGWRDSDGDGWLDKDIDGVRTPFRFVVKSYDQSPEWDRTLGIFKDELRRLNIDMDYQALEWKTLLKAYEDRDFDAVVGGWMLGYECDFVQLWHSREADTPSGSNHCGLKNAEVDELAERLRRTFDFDERVRIARRVQEILAAEQPYTFSHSSEAIFVWQNRAASGRQALAGVTWMLDHMHPFVGRFSMGRATWHFAR